MKKEIRERFRIRTFERDKYRCRMCGFTPPAEAWKSEKLPLDAHHITDRNLMPFGGYVPQNGISLCPQCHELAELYHLTGVPHPGYSPSDLYAKIGSGYDLAVQESFTLDPANNDVWRNVAGAEKYLRLNQLRLQEQQLLLVLKDQPSAISWELVCEEAGETDPNILLYGKGRY